MIVVDTSFVYALLDRSDARHLEAATWYSGVDEEPATTPLVVAEIDHLARARAGDAAVRAFRADLAAGAYLIEWWPSAVADSVAIADAYDDLALSLADASLVALCGRLETTTLASFDERHFRAVRPLAHAPAFSLVPRDAG